MKEIFLEPVKVVEIEGVQVPFHWVYGRVTITWENVIEGWHMATGLCRIHDDSESIPGDYHSSVTVIVKNGVYREEMYIAPEEYHPKRHEYRAFYKYLEEELGLKPAGHIRARTGKTARAVPPRKQ